MKGLHTVQFFDGPESLGRDVAAYLIEGLTHHDRLLLMARRAHVEAIVESLAAHSISAKELMACGQLTVSEPAAALRMIMSNGRPHAESFQRVVANAIRTEAARGPGQLRV